jgi:hypothetical protein
MLGIPEVLPVTKKQKLGNKCLTRQDHTESGLRDLPYRMSLQIVHFLSSICYEWYKVGHPANALLYS